MDEKDFQDLLEEIDSMSVEEYNKFHEEAIKMKQSRVFIRLSEDYVDSKYEITIVGSFSTENTLCINSKFTAVYIMLKEFLPNIEIEGDGIWAEAA